MQTEFIDSELASVVQQKKVDLQTITDLKNFINNLKAQLTDLLEIITYLLVFLFPKKRNKKITLTKRESNE